MWDSPGDYSVTPSSAVRARGGIGAAMLLQICSALNPSHFSVGSAKTQPGGMMPANVVALFGASAFGLFADGDNGPDWFLRAYAVVTTLAAGGAGAYAWWSTQRQKLTAEEIERRKLAREEQERDEAKRTLPLTVVLAELKEDYRKIVDGRSRMGEELTDLKVRSATLETRLANTEQRLATTDTRCATLERENIEIRRERDSCKETQERQEREIEELRRRADANQSQGGGT